MPEVDGFEILERIRSTSNLTHLPVIMLTSASDASTKLQALDLGATDFLSKPVDPSELSLRVRNTLAAKAYLDQLAFYDGLTQLPNRQLFIDRIDWAIQRATRSQEELAILHIVLDDFNRVAETFGPKVGDEVIKQVAERIDGCVRGSDAIGRVGVESQSAPSLFRMVGAEFSVLCPVINDAESAARVAQRILDSLKTPFDAEGTEVSIAASVGIAGYPTDGDKSALLIRRAVGASSQARGKGGNRYEFFSSEINNKAMQRMQIEADLRRGIENGELVLHYQPKINVQTGQFYGVEALVRWQRSPDALVYPCDFIEIAEENDLIVRIGDWVLQTACDQLQSWHDQGFKINVAINLSAKQFFDSDLLGSVRGCLERKSFDARSLTLELTESLLMADANAAVEVLGQLKALGPRISIDDFGTGYSSLSYLKKFPLDELKIDRAFIMEVTKDPKDKAIVAAVTYMAHQLGLSVVAEGVEESIQLDFLREAGCDIYQGYFFSRPVSADALTAMLVDARGSQIAI
jgi:diguanylate cyclase (GGDEF)-like protein